MKVTQRRRTRRGGFTLTEMLIVLAILVMLVSLVVPRFLGARKKADKQAAQAQIALFRGALERYNLDTKDFPSTEQGLQALLASPGDGKDGGEVVGWDGPYLNKDAIPVDPWNHDYQYAYPAERGSMDFPDIWSFGPDGEDNTDDDICSWSVKSGDEGGDAKGAKPNRDVDVDVNVGGSKGGGGGGAVRMPSGGGGGGGRNR
jgi:general secretion pathway protein G